MSVTQRMPTEQARFSLATWRNYEISASRRARVSEQSAHTCVEDRALASRLPPRLTVEYKRMYNVCIVRSSFLCVPQTPNGRELQK